MLKKANCRTPSSESPPTPLASQIIDLTVNRDFEASDFLWLSKNFCNRWRDNSPEIGHALIRITEGGTEIAEQYNIPQDETSKQVKTSEPAKTAPIVRQLIQIQAFQDHTGPQNSAVLYYRALTLEGKTMVGTRANRVDIVDTKTGAVEQARIVYFSPERKRHYHGTAEEIPLFAENLSKKQQELKQKLEAADATVKGGRSILIEPDSIKQREKMKRSPSQKDVMKGRSAVKQYAHFVKEKSAILHPKMLKKLKTAISADLNHAILSHERPEWSHVYAFSLMPVSENPQLPENLVAAPRWFNTAMLVPECTANWFASNRPHAELKMRAVFETLMNDEILKKGEYEISIKEKSRCIRLFECYDLSLKSAVFRKSSDLAQITAISNRLLERALPISCYTVEGQSIAAALPIINSMVIFPKKDLHVNNIPNAVSGHKRSANELNSPEALCFGTKKNLFFSRMGVCAQRLFSTHSNQARMSRILKKLPR